MGQLPFEGALFFILGMEVKEVLVVVDDCHDDWEIDDVNFRPVTAPDAIDSEDCFGDEDARRNGIPRHRNESFAQNA